MAGRAGFWHTSKDRESYLGPARPRARPQAIRKGGTPMKTYRQTRDILHWLSQQHARRADHMAFCRAAEDQRHAAWLLERMVQQEQILGEALRKLGANASEEMLDTYFQFVPEEDETALFLDQLPPPHGLSDQEATAFFMNSSKQLEALYRRLAELSEFEPVREGFADMARQIYRKREKTAESLGPFKSV
jgi:hypothetical protein